MISIFGCGDVFVSKRLPKMRYDGFEEISSVMNNHEVCFGNLETTVHENEGYPSAFPGGGYAMANPTCLSDLRDFGFNVFTLANNHALDYCHKGLEATVKYLREQEYLFCGAGINLLEAAKPVFVDCKEGRVAFIGVTSSFHDSDSASLAGGIVPGRPGVNPLRRTEYYELVPQLFEHVIEIANETGMNDGHLWSIANGYRENVDGCFLREMKFVCGNKNQRVTHPLEKDMNRIEKTIKDALCQADCVIVSFHSHQMEGSNEIPANFIKEFCYKCIDAGANAVLGHGAHEIRGMEVYKNAPIFYGMGDFIFHNEMQEVMPHEFYEKLQCNVEEIDCVGIAMNKRSKNMTRGLQADSKAWESIGVSLIFDEGKIKKAEIYPISLGFNLGYTRRGWPTIDKSGDILKRFCEISKTHHNTDVNINGKVGSVLLG